MDADDFVGDSEEEEETLPSATAPDGGDDHVKHGRLYSEHSGGVDHEAIGVADSSNAPPVNNINASPPLVKTRDTSAQREQTHASSSDITRTLTVADVPGGTTAAESSDDDEGGGRPLEANRSGGARDLERNREGDSAFAVGDLVEVESRTWPGINKPGGAARVAAVHRETSADGTTEVFYNVKYILGGFEKLVPREFVQLTAEVQKSIPVEREKHKRNFYHDEFAEDAHRKKQKRTHPESVHGHGHQPQAPTRQKTSSSRRSKASTVGEAAPDDNDDDHSSSDGDSDGDWRGTVPADGAGARKMDDNAFMLFTRRGGRILESGSEEDDNAEKSASSRKPIDTQRKRKNDKLTDRPLTDQARPDFGLTATDDRGTQVSPERERRRSKKSKHHSNRTRTEDPSRRRSTSRSQKRRRFVGGYEHDGDDPDATFIQPEDNPAALPDDVARITKFKPAKTKRGLRDQFEERFTAFKEHLKSFADERAAVESRLGEISSASANQLRDLYYTLNRLGKFVTEQLRRNGEDVLNIIVKSLEKTNSPVPESKLFDLDNLVEQIQSNSVWTQHAISSVEAAFQRRDIQYQAVEFAQDESSNDDSSDSETNVKPEQQRDDIYANSDNYDDFESGGYLSDDYFVRDKGSGSRRRAQTVGQGRQTFDSQTASRTMNGGRRTKIKTSTTLDDYAFVGYGSSKFVERIPVQTNFRLIKNRLSGASPLSDPRWNWLKLAKQKRQALAVKRIRANPFERSSASSGGRVQQQRDSSKDTSGSIHSDLVRMRNKRYRNSKQSNLFHHQSARMEANSGLSYSSRPISADRILPATKVVHNVTAHHSASSKHEHTASVSSTGTNWRNVFTALPEHTLDPESRASPLDRQQLLRFGYLLADSSNIDGLLTRSDWYARLSSASITRRAAQLRQLLTDMRMQEFEFLELLAAGDWISNEGDIDVESIADYRALKVLEDEYSRAMAEFCAGVIVGMPSVPTAALSEMLEILLTEMSLSIRQLPDCKFMFDECPQYVFYFELAVTSAKTTPLLSSITRTYWYFLQLLFVATTPGGPISDQIERQIAQHLPPNRVVLAAILFLFDWYLYLPISHRSNGEHDAVSDPSEAEPTSTAVPSLCLWHLISDCLKGDIWPTTSITCPPTREKTFWDMLQTIYQESYFERLTTHFLHEESPGGYLWESPPQKVDPFVEVTDEGDMQVRLLAQDSKWELFLILADLFGGKPAQDTAICDCKWQIARCLLYEGNSSFLPFKTSSSQGEGLAAETAHRFALHRTKILQRVLRLSRMLLPDKDTLVVAIQGCLNSPLAVPNESSTIQLPAFLQRCALLELNGSPASVEEAFTDDDEVDESYQEIALLCRILLTQAVKPEKPAHRRRFRLPVLRVAETLKALGMPSEKKQDDVRQNTSTSVWNWGSKAPVVPKPPTPKVVPPLKHPRNSNETQTTRYVTSILLTLAILSFNFDGDGKTVDNTTKSLVDKYRNREAGLYGKEIIRVAREQPMYGVLASQALYVMGSMLLRAAVGCPVVFEQLNLLLTNSMATLRQEVAGFPEGSKVVKQTMQYRYINAPIRKMARENRFYELQSAVLSSLHLMRDLTNHFCDYVSQMEVSALSIEVDAAKATLAAVINTGLDSCLEAGVDELISVKDLNIAIEMLQLLIPRCQDVPNLALRVLPVDNQIQDQSDEFDSLGMDDIWASVDLDVLTGQTSTVPTFSIEELRPHALQLVSKEKFPKTLQKLVTRYPDQGDSYFQELFVIDLFGMVVSTCEFSFSWSRVSKSSARNNLPSRLFGAAIKYNPDKEWFCNRFLSEPGSDQAVANLWMMATVDTSTLSPSPLTFKGNDVSYSIDIAPRDEPPTSPHIDSSRQIRDSNFWVMLTDGLIYNLLRDDTLIPSKMDKLVYTLLRRAASMSTLPRELRDHPAASTKFSSLYTLHLDLFKAFAKTSGDMWREFRAQGDIRRQDLNRLRSITVDPQTGIFATFISAYKTNVRKAGDQIEGGGHNLFKILQKFMNAYAPKHAKSFHDIDDSIDLLEEAVKNTSVRMLLAMLRFLYQCVDAFFFHCGDMAIGHNNLFFTMMQLLFRQTGMAEYTQAQARLQQADTRKRILYETERHEDPLSGLQPLVMRFVHSLQVFFAQQNYPSLLHWFAMTSQSYQTFASNGWPLSPLRTLMVNVVDPDGPLGINDYYSIEMHDSKDIDIKSVRREAFYLACGLFNCTCTDSFEHCKADQDGDNRQMLVRNMRVFLVTNFVRESLEFASENLGHMDETLLPLCQFLRAVLNHGNLNRRPSDECAGGAFRVDSTGFNIQETYPSIEWITLYIARAFSPERAVQNGLRIVLLLEFCGLMSESIRLNATDCSLRFTRLLDITLAYLWDVNDVLSRMSSQFVAPLSRGFGLPLVEQLASFDASTSSIADFKEEWITKAENVDRSSSADNSYDINLPRARADLMLAIGQLFQQHQTVVGGAEDRDGRQACGELTNSDVSMHRNEQCGSS